MRKIFATIASRCTTLGLAACFLTAFTIKASANTYNVTQTSDGHNVTQLRGAIEAADAAGGTHTINVPAGTYNLTLGEITFGNGAQNISIIGAGSGSTIINMTSTNQDRIFFINPPGTIPDVTTSISGIKFTNGYLTSDVYGGSAVICGGPNNNMTITNCVFENNAVGISGSYGGGAINMQGGGNLSIDQSTFTNNSTSSLNGGAIYILLVGYENLTGSVNITNSTFTGNKVTTTPFAIGGAITVVTQTPKTGQSFPVNILKNSFINNSVVNNGEDGDGGGAIYVESGFPTNINYNRFSGNKMGAASDAVFVSRFQGGTTNATNNWWGCNDDPTGASACAEKAFLSTSVGNGSLVTAPRLQLKTTAGASALCQGGTTTTLVTASFLTNSSNNAISTANLARLIGLPISFSVANGSLSGAQSAIQSNGNATVTFNGNAGTGASSVNAVVDKVSSTDGLAKAAIAVSSAPTISAGNQPASFNGCASGSVNFTVGVTSAATVTYQWFKGTTQLNNGATGTGSTISGATTATLTITNPGATDVATTYKCVANNGCGSVTSNTAALSVLGSRLYVTTNGSGDGSSWNAALGSLTTALNIASGCSSVKEIWVKTGTYIPSANPYNTFTFLPQDNAFTLANGVTIYGGFAGTETALAQRNINANPTILSGDIGLPNNISDNCFHVVVSVGNNSATALDGFTITGGNTGSGVANANFNGAGVSRINGGGISLTNSSAKITNCKITGNSSSAGGGGLFQSGGSIKVSNCVFSNNSAQYGGAVRNEGTPTLAITSCVFTANISTASGAAMSLFQGKDTVANNLFIKNNDHGVSQGGGALCTASADFYITNNTFYADTTSGRGGAISAESTDGTLQLYNNIFYKNYGAKGNNDINNITTSYTQSSNIFGNVNPLFINENDADGADNVWATTDDGMNLQVSSTALDAGNNSKVPAGITTDITGATRIQNDIVNIGAYEGGDYTYSTIYVDSSVAVSGDGGTWATAFKTMSDAFSTVRRFSNINTILAAKGTYYPTGSQAGTNKDSTFLIRRGGLKLYGGYPTGGGTRNIAANPTILSGNIGDANTKNDNSYHVMVMVSIGSGADSVIIDGLTISDGYAAAGGGFTYGSINMYQGNGGGVYLISNANKIVFNNIIFIRNAAINAAGGFDVNNSAPLISNCIFTGNIANNMGGGLFNEVLAQTVVVNSVFTGNSSNNGGAMYNSSCSPVIANCTIYANTATSTAGGIYSASSTGSISNSIIWGNTGANPGINIINIAPTISNSLIQGGNAGIAPSDPLFTNTANIIGPDNIWGTDDDGLNLQVLSPAFDAGNNTKIPGGVTTDITGSARIQNGAVNAGAYEKGIYGYSTIYVDSSKAVAGDGGSWGNALKTLSDAVNIARRAPNVNTILVAKGTYYPTGSQSSTNRDSAFAILRGGLKILGGYPSGGGSRNADQNPTYLDGNINTAGNTDNSLHIMVLAGIGSGEDSVIIDGLNFRNGMANVTGTKTYNGRLVNSSFGAGVYLESVTNAQKTVFRNCTFTNNTVNTGGGAIFQISSMLSLFDCVFLNNSAYYGGAVRNEGSSVLTVLGSAFVSNVSTQSGGAMSLYQGTDTLANNIFVKNKDNSTTQGGGALCISSAYFYIVNNTFYADTTMGKGGAISAESATGTLKLFNNIFYKNNSPLGNDDINNITTAYEQLNNSFGADPLFVNESNVAGTDGLWGTSDDGLQLKPASPGIDAGDNTKLPAGITTDIAGIDRIQGSAVDLGAYEKQVVAIAPLAALVKSAGNKDSVCYGYNRTITIITAGGVKPYQYSLNGGAYQASANFAVPKGTHTITVKDSTGATVNTGITITQPAVKLTAVIQGGASNSVVVNAAGGYGGYTYSYNNGAYQSSNIFTGVHTGDAITTADNAGCIITTNISTVAASVKSAGNKDSVCYGDTRIVSVAATGGVQPYQYSLNGGAYQAAANFAVPKGTHTITVKDATGATVNTNSITITQPAVKLTSVIQTGSGSSIVVNATGGYGGYTYSRNNGPYQPSNVFTGVNGGDSITTADKAGCIIKAYVSTLSALVKSAGNKDSVCYGYSRTITIITAGGVKPYQYSLNGGAYQVSANFALPKGTHTITVKDATGSTVNISKTITQPAARLTSILQGSSSSSIAVNAAGGYGGYTYSHNNDPYQPSNVFTGVHPGDSITTADNAGCTIKAYVSTLSALVKSVGDNDSVCYGHTRTVTVITAGGVKPYQYSLNGGAYQPSAVFALPKGTHTLTAKDATGATVDVSKTITQPSIKPGLTVVKTDVSCNGGNDGSITATGTGGYGSYLYSKDAVNYQPGSTFSNLQAGTVNVYVKDGAGCIISQGFTVTQPATPCGSSLISGGGDNPTSNTAEMHAELKVKVLPNPAQVEFNMQIVSGDSRNIVEVRVMDMNGKIMYRTRGSIFDMFRFGRTFASGMYVAEVMNGRNIQRIKLAKAN